MADTFTLQVPAASSFRALVPDVAGRYAELAGGSSRDADAIRTVVTEAIERLLAGSPSDAVIDVAFRPDRDGVQVELRSNGRREAVSVTIPVAKR